MELAKEAFGDLAGLWKLSNATMRMSARAGQQWFTLLLLAGSYMEWGSGGSTVLASWRAVQHGMLPLRIDSVDSSAAWHHQLISKNPVLAEAEAAGKLSFRPADIGTVGEWGAPAHWSMRPATLQRKQAKGYVEKVNASRCCYDLVMVDGRFRVACMLHALRLAHRHTVVVVHDAPRYLQHPAVLRFYHVVFEVGELAALRPKEGAIKRAKAGNPHFLSFYNTLLLDSG